MSSTVRPLNAPLAEIARVELNEDPKRREQDLTHIKDWLKKQPHLNARTDDQWLLTFLRGCKFSLERTKEKIDMYYTMRSLLPEYSTNRDPMLPEIQEVLRLGVWLPLPTPDAKGCRVFLNRVGLTDPSRVKMADVMKTFMLIVDVVLQEDDHMVVAGNVDVMDMVKVTLGHAAQITPSFAKKTVTCFQEGFPLRPKGVNYVNTPPMFDTVFNLFKVVMKEKLRKRVKVHGDDMAALYKEVPRSILPAEYGGDAGPIADLIAHWKAKVESYRDFFLADEVHRSDERKRVGKPKTQAGIFGIEGSFRQLSLD